MDIEDYLKRKRELESKKEYLESRESLKETREKKRKELEGEKKRFVSRRSEEPSKPEAPVAQGGPHDFYRKIIGWNVLILVLVFALFAVAYFLPMYGEDQIKDIVGEEKGEITGNVVLEEGVEETEEETVVEEDEELEEEPEKYPGPGFLFHVEDADLGKFDQYGRIGGENLIINTPYYNDAVIYLQNEESSRIICYVDRHITVDKDFDGKTDLEDFDLDFIIDELDSYGKFDWKDSLPGAFKEGDYNGKGSVSVKYDSRCYYCIDKGCSGGGDKDGESSMSIKLKFKANPLLFVGNNTNSS